MFLEQIASRRLRLAANGLTPHKAKIINLSEKKTFLNNTLEVSFNPESINYSTCPIYTTVKDIDAPGGKRVTYSGNMDNELEMTLLFDTTTTGHSVHEKYIKFLIELTEPEEGGGGDRPQPPECRFLWGDFTKKPYLSFDAVLGKLDVDYIWFLPNGKPVRATVKLKFKQPSRIKKGQNPTSRSEARRVWRVIEGQTLDWIAFKEYGDSTAWRHIAQVNHLQNPRDLRPGMVLMLVPLP